MVLQLLNEWNKAMPRCAVRPFFISQIKQIEQAGAAYLKHAPEIEEQHLRYNAQDDEAIGQSQWANVNKGEYLGNEVAVKVMRRAVRQGSGVNAVDEFRDSFVN